ncbi:TolC family protein [bacterium]|nr:TolC family protein [bacterium]
MSKKHLAFLLVFLFMAAIYGKISADDNLEALTLNQCLSMALQNNPQIQSHYEKVKMASALKGQALSYFFPSLSVEAGWTILDHDRVSNITLPDEYYDLFVFTYAYFSMKDEILDGGYSPWGYGPETDPLEFTKFKKYYDEYGSGFLDPGFIPPGETEPIPQDLKIKVLQQYFDAADTIPQSIESGYLGGHYFGSSFKLTQPIFTFGKISGRYQQAGWNEELKMHEQAESVQAIFSQICQTYFALSQGEQLLGLAEEMESRFKMLRVITKALMKSTRSKKNQYDYMTIKVYANKIEHMKQETLNKVEKGNRYLQLLLGSGNSVTIRGNTRVPNALIVTVEESFDTMQTKNHNWQQLELGEKLAEKEVEVARAELFPMIGVSGEFNTFHEEPEFGNMPESSWQVTVGASWTFPLGMGSISVLREKQAAYASAKKEVVYAKHALTTQMEVLLKDLESSVRSLQRLEKAEADARERSQLAIEGYRIDEVKTSDMIEAQVDESEVRIEYLETCLEYQNQMIEYIRMMGKDLHEQVF